MKHGKLICYLIVSGFLFWCGCGSGNSPAANEKILQSPPYATVTDSIKKFPDNATLYLERGTLLSQNNNHEIATADYKKAWELQPSDSAALQYISNMLLVNKTKEAVTLLKECITKFPANLEFRRRLSELYEQTGQVNKALEQNEEMLKKDSTNFESWNEKGKLLIALKDTAGALAALEYSYRMQPINYTGLMLASLYAARRDSRAISLCDEMIKRDTTGTLADAYFVKGAYYSDSRQYNAAVAQFDQCIRIDWKFTDAYVEKGIVLFEQKLYDSAMHVFAMGATVSNTIADPYFWIGRCFEAKGNKSQAITNYERALSLDPRFTEAAERIKKLED